MDKFFRDKHRLEELACKYGYSVERLAQHFSLSSRQFRYLFEKEIGIPPKTWLIDSRVKRAISMFEEGASVEQVSEALSYSSEAHMRTEIKKTTGVTLRKLNLINSFTKANI